VKPDVAAAASAIHNVEISSPIKIAGKSALVRVREIRLTCMAASGWPASIIAGNHFVYVLPELISLMGTLSRPAMLLTHRVREIAPARSGALDAHCAEYVHVSYCERE
jgi:hypothetical protein